MHNNTHDSTQLLDDVVHMNVYKCFETPFNENKH